MRKFMLGVVFTLILLASGLYAYLERGYVNLRADAQPSRLEAHYAMRSVDASSARHGPQQKNPTEPNEANLIDAVKLYQAHCALCHGRPGETRSELGPFYPPAPQFVQHPPTDMTESQDFTIIQHGIRWAGMPAWGGKLSEDQIWQLAGFLSHLGKLPPAAERQWNTPAR